MTPAVRPWESQLEHGVGMAADTINNLSIIWWLTPHLMIYGGSGEHCNWYTQQTTSDSHVRSCTTSNAIIIIIIIPEYTTSRYTSGIPAGIPGMMMMMMMIVLPAVHDRTWLSDVVCWVYQLQCSPLPPYITRCGVNHHMTDRLLIVSADIPTPCSSWLSQGRTARVIN